MSKEIIIINQPAGLGDIFYLQKAAKILSQTGIVYWPIQKEFEYLSEYLSHPNINYFNMDNDYPYKNLCQGSYNLFSRKSRQHINLNPQEKIYYIPFTHSHYESELLGSLISRYPMLTKYSLIDMTNDFWQNYFTFKRNTKRENLLKKKYNIKNGEDFIFVNDLFASPPEMLKRNIPIKTNIKVVYNDGLPCHIFDYCWILENAKEVHLIESAFCYLVEVLNTTDNLFMYSRIINGRQQHKNFDYIKGIHKKSWNKIYD